MNSGPPRVPMRRQSYSGGRLPGAPLRGSPDPSRPTGAPLRGSPDPSGSCRREPAVAQGDQHGQGDGQQDQAEGDGRLQVGLQGQVDGQGHGLGDPGQVAGEGDGGPELAQGPGPAQGHPGPQGGGDQGQGDPGEGAPAAGPQGGGGVLVAPVHGPQPGLAGDDQERHGHEGLGQDRPGGGERQGDPEPLVEPAAGQPATAEGQQQGDSADHRRQHHGQGGQGPDQVAAGELDPGEQERERDPEHDRDRDRAQGADQRQPQRLQHPGAGQLGPDAAPRGPDQQAGQGDGQEGDGQGGRDGEPGRGPGPGPGGGRPAAPGDGGHVVGGGRNPYFFRTCWPSADRTRSRNASAPASSLAALTVASG